MLLVGVRMQGKKTSNIFLSKLSKISILQGIVHSEIVKECHQHFLSGISSKGNGIIRKYACCSYNLLCSLNRQFLNGTSQKTFAFAAFSRQQMISLNVITQCKGLPCEW